jgi:tetratricopeptide (TPR) repeat protein
VLDDAEVPADECLATGILMPDGAGLRFRHELVRMAVEAGITPYRKTELHARLLAEMEPARADPALLAHHAEGAGDSLAVLRHAPEAARRSAALGAHREAAAQYERALRNAMNHGKPSLAALYEGAATEYSLLDRWEEAEQARRSALALRRELGDQEQVGANLRLLSITMWRLCRGEESDRAAEEAVAVLEALPPGKELAWAYGNLATSGPSLGLSEETALGLLDETRDLGERLGHPDVVCYALNAAGLRLIDTGRDGMPEIGESVRLALASDLPEAAGRATAALSRAG